jgi:glycosyltransferase involved in cell wall biosynthesis
MRVGVYRGPHTNSSDAMTYKLASGEGIEFDFITDPSMTVSQVLANNYDVIDVPDPLYPFTQEIIEKHPCVVVTVWENLPWNMLGADWKRCFEKAALIVCRSPMARQSAIEAAGCDPYWAIVIPAGVDTERFKPSWKIPKTVLYVGRMEWEKGIFDLIMAAKGQDWNLTMVGDGSMLDQAKRFAEILRIVNVSFIGKVPHERVQEYYSSSEVFCYPSIPTPRWQEQFGISVLEAAASGCRIILSKQSVFQWFQREIASIELVNPGDYLDLRNRIFMALKQYPFNGSIFGNQYRDNLLESFSSKGVGKQLQEAYAKLAVAVG